MTRRGKKSSVQTSLFSNVSNFVPIEEYRETVSKKKKPKQHEKKFMSEVMGIANSLDLPCVHIDHFCGNKFYPTCAGSKKNPHPPVRAICPICKKDILAKCINIINKNMAHHYDILGIGWGIETKHKRNKGKEIAKGDIFQQVRGLMYDAAGIPNITANESNIDLIFDFLKLVKKMKG